MDLNLTIKPDAAIDDAQKINEIVGIIDESMRELDEVINTIIPDKLETVWSVNLKRNWNHFYAGTIKESMQAMRFSAENLKRAVDAAIEYGKQ